MFYSVHELERKHFENRDDCSFQIGMTNWTLNQETLPLALGCDAISVFIYDELGADILQQLKLMNIELILVRAAGLDHVDLETAKQLKIKVKNIADYGPESVAEHTLMLMLTAAKKLKKNLMQTERHYFGLKDIEGSILSGKTIGIIGAGSIGLSLMSLLKGFKVSIIVYDIKPNPQNAISHDFKYVDFKTLIKHSDIITLHLPLNPLSYKMIKKSTIDQMKRNCILVNTSRGGIVDTKDILSALDTNTIAGYATDVYDKEKEIFHHEQHIVIGEELEKLICHDKVMLTPHTAFATDTAISNIAFQTLYQLEDWCVKKVENEMYEI